MDADAAIRAVVSRLPPSDVAFLLESRGLPARSGPPGAAAAALTAALTDELVEWEWEAGDVGTSGYHAPVLGAGGSLVVIPGGGGSGGDAGVGSAGAIFFYGGLNADRVESSDLWKWDLAPAATSGFEPVQAANVPPSFTSGHFAAAGPDGRLYVFPGPRNAELDHAYAFDPATARWEAVEFEGGGVGPNDPAARRAIAAVPQPGGGALLALGGPAAAHTLHRFHWRTRSWDAPIPLTGGPPGDGAWLFGGAAFQPDGGGGGGGRVIMWGATPPPPAASVPDDGPPVQVWALDWPRRAWTRLADGPAPPPPLRTHAAGAVACGRLLIQGGRRPGEFNVTADAWEYDLVGGRGWRALFASEVRGGTGGSGGAGGGVPGLAAREWHAAAGLADCAVFVGGRTAIPFDDLSPDTMSTAVSCLWSRAKAADGADAPPSSSSRRPAAPIGRAATLAALAAAGPPGSLSDPTVDVVLVASGGEAGAGTPGRFPAHRLVLAAHSAVFAAMWASPMLEGGRCGRGDGGRPGCPPDIALPDVAPPTAAALLAYCYGSAAALPASVPALTALFEAADKYDMPSLVAECVAGLRARAHPAHVAGLLALADARQCAPLRDVCAEAAARALPAVLATPSFAALVTDAPSLGLGLISEVVTRLGVASADGGGEDGGGAADGGKDGKAEDGDGGGGGGGGDDGDGGSVLSTPPLSPRSGAGDDEGEDRSAPATPAGSPPASPRPGPAAPPTPAQ